MPFPENCELANLQVAASVLVQGSAAAGARRIDRSDQISGDSQSSWTIAMQAPTNLTANALRVMNESGSGRTRAETNWPQSTSAHPATNVTVEKQS